MRSKHAFTMREHFDAFVKGPRKFFKTWLVVLLVMLLCSVVYVYCGTRGMLQHYFPKD